jgi:very-short-patch-repair endonuclease
MLDVFISCQAFAVLGMAGKTKSNIFAGAGKLLLARTGDLRKKQTFSEELLWQYLKTKPLGFKFRRQHAYGIYILDFYCHALKLVIEVDGSIHNSEEVKPNDAVRQKHLESDNLYVLRFRNDEIRLNKEEVINQIKSHLHLKAGL